MQFLKIGILLTATTLLIVGCKKKSAQAVVEEVPAATVADSATALEVEPSLEQVDGKLKGSAPSTFHTSKDPKNVSGSAEGFSESGRFVVQVSVFKSKQQARHLVEKLTNAGFPAYVASVDDPTPELAGTYHRVRIGNFASIRAAQNFGETSVKSQGFDYWVDKKSNDHTASPSESYSSPSSSPSNYSAPVSTPVEEPAPSYNSTPTPPAEPAAPVSEPVGVPEPPAPSEPAAPQDDSWGNPLSDTAPSETAKPAVKDTGAVEGW